MKASISILAAMFVTKFNSKPVEIQRFCSEGVISDPHITFLCNVLGPQLTFILQ